MANYLKVYDVDTATEYIYYISNLTSLRIGYSIDVLQESLPDQSAEENPVLKIGATMDLAIEWTIVDSDTDVSNGHNIKTVQEQFQYLANYFFTGNMSLKYYLYIEYLDKEYEGSIARANVDLEAGTKMARGSLNFMVGKNIIE